MTPPETYEAVHAERFGQTRPITAAEVTRLGGGAPIHNAYRWLPMPAGVWDHAVRPGARVLDGAVLVMCRGSRPLPVDDRPRGRRCVLCERAIAGEHAPCGTTLGNYRHRRHRETPCQPCKDAMTTYRRGRYPVRTERRAVAEQLPGDIGQHAGTDHPHHFRPLGPTVGAPQCADCFGYFDDPRHP